MVRIKKVSTSQIFSWLHVFIDSLEGAWRVRIVLEKRDCSLVAGPIYFLRIEKEKEKKKDEKPLDENLLDESLSLPEQVV